MQNFISNSLKITCFYSTYSTGDRCHNTNICILCKSGQSKIV